MAGKHKRKRAPKRATPGAPEPLSPPRVATSLGAKLGVHRARASRPAPQAEATKAEATLREAPEAAANPRTALQAEGTPCEATRAEPASSLRGSALSDEERALLERALTGVTPLGDRRGRVPRARVASRHDAEGAERDGLQARARLGALVAGDVRFVIEREADGGVTGRRSDRKPGVVDQLYGLRWQPEARIDLHGQRVQEAAVSLSRFVREQSQRGVRRVLIVHGKGRHSEGGIGVLDDVTVRALTEGGAAPLVEAFGTARRDLGGTGALMVQLRATRSGRRGG